MPRIALFALAALLSLSPAVRADENLFGYVKGVETLPKGSWEVYEILTSRDGKGKGKYHAIDAKTEIEYGVTDRFNVAGELKFQRVHSSNILLDAYIPKDIKSGVDFSGLELAMKYNFLRPALDDFGLAAYYSVAYDWLDKHSGQKKKQLSNELLFLFQKYFLEGELIWVANLGVESTFAKREFIADLPSNFEWPAHPEMEIELISGTGLSYRVAPQWFVGAELLHETEYETEVGQERWSLFGGPTVHFASQKWWATLTWFPQLIGGKPYEDQAEEKLHLTEKTKQEVRLKVGFNF